jgi:hypothetical protein
MCCDWGDVGVIVCTVVHGMTCNSVCYMLALYTAKLGVGSCITRFTK